MIGGAGPGNGGDGAHLRDRQDPGARRAGAGESERDAAVSGGYPGRPHRRRGVFMISIAAELAQMHPQTLRTYEARGLVSPQRSAKGTRLYSEEDVEVLVRIQQMVNELGLNLAGVERVLELEGDVVALRSKVLELEARERAFAERLDATIAAVTRSFRAEIVPYRPAAGTDLVRLIDTQRPFGRVKRARRYGNAA